ncbi:hypothetical protein B0T26DRAFT_297543 [Lasiosphaeria miniovina]|uniref:Uncharacterized protein n=1 Tax=Lasiosphaeria miniovina TaxID=1954250 RepID=A0AA40AKD2_9PEZI|nr:uncharacterized protein B0T26DRAFT_297543 [Lasiosphaeria miniovina]KAK0717481.1 hypothetical protein B0T26DRAFT_297543 [Lasiosphaeria miniovina]
MQPQTVGPRSILPGPQMPSPSAGPVLTMLLGECTVLSSTNSTDSKDPSAHRPTKLLPFYRVARCRPNRCQPTHPARNTFRGMARHRSRRCPCFYKHGRDMLFATQVGGLLRLAAVLSTCPGRHQGTSCDGPYTRRDHTRVYSQIPSVFLAPDLISEINIGRCIEQRPVMEKPLFSPPLESWPFAQEMLLFSWQDSIYPSAFVRANSSQEQSPIASLSIDELSCCTFYGVDLSITCSRERCLLW